MNEYISKEALQDKLNRKKAGPATKRYTEGWNDAILMVKSMIHSEKAADVAPVQEWVSIDDRLPEEGEYVLCSLKGFNYGGNIQVCKFVPADKFKDKPYFEHFRNGFPSVTHWMPLPKPPKGE